MNKLISIVGVASLVAISSLASALDLTVTVTNVKKPEGNLYIRIYDSSSKWLSQDKESVRATQVIALAEQKNLEDIKATFDLPPGKYAATVVQDVNNNGVLDKNWMGKPTEPSGNTSKSDGNGPPVFDDSTFELNVNTQKSIRLFSY